MKKKNLYLISYQYNTESASGFGFRTVEFSKVGYDELIAIIKTLAEHLETRTENIVILAVSKLEE